MFDTKVLSSYNNVLLRTIEQKAVHRYETDGRGHQGYLLNNKISNNELFQLQQECKLLVDKMKGNSMLKRIMRDINFISGMVGIFIDLDKVNLDSERTDIPLEATHKEAFSLTKDRYLEYLKQMGK